MDLTSEQQARLVRMKAAMKMSELYAAKWIAAATTGTAGRRIVSKGDRRLTPEELTDEALKIACSHIERVGKVADNISLLLEGREDEIEPG